MSNYHNMKILITGGLGFIGSNFVRYIIDKFDKVYVLDNLSYGASLSNLRNINCKIVFGSICNFNLVSDLVKKVDIIVNFAAETHVDRSISDPSSFVKTNILGVHTILEAVRKSDKPIRLIHISTDEVYGSTEDSPFNEDDKLLPSSPYSASKASSDLLVLSYVETYSIDALITRCTNNYGPYQFPEKLVPKTIIRSLMNMKIPIYGTGKNIRDWIYVKDHCKAIELLMDKGKKGEIYNISSGEEKTNIEVVKEILKLLGKDEDLIEFVEDRKGHYIRYSLNTQKIRQICWSTEHCFREGIIETIGWYLNNEWWWESLANKKILHPTPWKLSW